MKLPRLVIAAAASGQGKTTVAVGLMAALTRAGHRVAPAKVGPDYIDPGYHALATGRPGRNLDPWLCGEELMAPLLAHDFLTPEPADLAIIEGVMGLYDGRLGTGGFASTAQLATLTHSPVLLVLDISSAARTVAATVHGLATFDGGVQVAGVILNKAGSTRHADEVRQSVEAAGYRVLGVLPRDAGVSAPSRHLGLVPVAERDGAVGALDLLAEQVAEFIDLDAVLDVAAQAPDLDVEPWSPSPNAGGDGTEGDELTASAPESSASEAESSTSDPEPVAWDPEPPVLGGRAADDAARVRTSPVLPGPRPVVAVAGGRAFTFFYPETTELLRAQGVEPVGFDPAHDRDLPAGTAGLYLGGGFPELHATGLAGNTALRARIRNAIAAGMPTIAECAGLLYLCETLDGHEMTGAIDARAAMHPTLRLQYHRATLAVDSVLGPAGTVVHGHEFHRTRVHPAAGPSPAWLFGDEPEGFALDPAGTGRATVHASYLHTHWAGSPDVAASFAGAVRGFAAGLDADRAQGVDVGPPADGLDASGAPGTVPTASIGQPPADGLDASGAPGTAPTASIGQHPAGSPWPVGPAGVVHSRVEPVGVSLSPVEPGTKCPSRNPLALPGQTPSGYPGSTTGIPLDSLQHHGDAELGDGLVDFAVNVRAAVPPPWLTEAITDSLREVAAYPSATAARRAIARRHGLPDDMVLPTNGAAEAFTLIARALAPRRAVVVHPQFTEPEVALRAAGHVPEHVLTRPGDGFALHAGDIPADTDLVVIGNPTNPTGVLHPRAVLEGLRRPGRIVVVDEAFMDAIPSEPETLIGRELAGVIVIRSLTKTWSIAGLRAGYVVADAQTIVQLEAQQPHWSVSTPAAAAMVATAHGTAVAEAAAGAAELGRWRDHLVAGLERLGLAPVPGHAPFVLVRVGEHVRPALRARGFAVRTGASFPGLGPDWIRIAVRPPESSGALLDALATTLQELR